MAQGLLDLFNRSLGAAFVSRVAQRLGETEAPIQLALDGLLPVLLGCMAQRGASAEGAQSLIRTIASVPLDPGMVAAPARLLAEDTGALERLTTMGPGILGFLLGNQAGRLAGAVAKVSGIRVSSASWLAPFVTALMCAVLSKEIQAKKLDAIGVQAMLGEQREALQESLDRRILAALGVTSLNGYLAEVTGTAKDGPSTIELAEQAGVPPVRAKTPFSGSLSWIALVLVVVMVWWLVRG